MVDSFNLGSVLIPKCTNGTMGESDVLWTEMFGGSSWFFGLVGVLSFFFVLASLYFYLFAWGNYESSERLSTIDFACTLGLACFWFVATWAWWTAANGIGALTTKEYITEQLKRKDFCDAGCSTTSHGHNSSLSISVLAGWACVLLFGANVWFVWKETIWFRNRQARESVGTTPPATHIQFP
ncbi:hypothetical protein L596_005342 [Steinernema carpocapsae]|nr:hypothetical protein L596_005342 [Steinernema carpocapsae]